VGHLHQQKYGKAFEEKQVVCRARGKKGEGFLTVIFPRKAGEPEPVIESWADRSQSFPYGKESEGRHGCQRAGRGQNRFPRLIESDAGA
jgi:hypothetical protein